MKSGIINTGVSLIDRDYHNDHNNVSILSIRIAPDGFSYAIFDTLRNKYTVLESFDLQSVSNENIWIDTIGILLEEKNIIPKSFLQVFIQSDFPGALPVPEALYHPDNKELLFKYNLQKSKDQILLEDDISNLGIVLLHPLSLKIKSHISSFFSSEKIIHQQSSLLSVLYNTSISEISGEQVFVQINKNSFECIIFNNKELLFCNSFQYKTAEDLLYFLLYTMKQHNLDPEKQKVVLMGNLTRSSAIASKAAKYIRFVHFIKKNTQDDFSVAFEAVEDHQFFNLLNLKNCGL
jgi:hypothetical protein